MTKQEYIKYLKNKRNKLYNYITNMKEQQKLQEKIVEGIESIIDETEDKIAEIDIELDEFDEDIWGSTEESQRAYMNDVL